MPTLTPSTRQCAVRLPFDALNALAAEAARLTAERGRIVSVASIIRAAVGSHLARTARVQRVAKPTSVEG